MVRKISNSCQSLVPESNWEMFHKRQQQLCQSRPEPDWITDLRNTSIQLGLRFGTIGGKKLCIFSVFLLRTKNPPRSDEIYSEERKKRERNAELTGRGWMSTTPVHVCGFTKSPRRYARLDLQRKLVEGVFIHH